MDNPDILLRRQKGKEGKLYRIEVLYKVGNEVRRVVISNRLGKEILEFRSRIFDIGLMVPIDPQHWQIISPLDLLEIHLWRQKKFFENQYK